MRAELHDFLETDYQCIGYQYIDNRLFLFLYDVFKLLQNTHRRNTQIKINYDSKFQSREKPPKNIFKFGRGPFRSLSEKKFSELGDNDSSE